MARSRFKTKVSKARFVVSPFTAQQMVELGQVAVDSIKARLERAENIYDQPAKPLSEGKRGTGYRRYKSRKAPPAIRSWKLTGRTLRGMNVLRANENRAVIGFSDPVAAMRAAINQKRERQFGLSPANWKDILRAVKRIRFVRVKSKAA
jgi:hypothetical protein